MGKKIVLFLLIGLMLMACPSFGATPKLIFMIGDSMTARAGSSWQCWFPDVIVINKGVAGRLSSEIAGDIVTDCNYALADKVFVMVGTADIAKNGDYADIWLNVAHIIENLKSKNPNVKIYIQSILPIYWPGCTWCGFPPGTCNYPPGTFVCGCTGTLVPYINQQIQDVIAAEQNNKKVTGLTYINLYPSFCNHSDYYVYDPNNNDYGIHLNDAGYYVWINLIRPYIYQ